MLVRIINFASIRSTTEINPISQSDCHLPKMKEAADAVTTLLDVRIRALPISTLSISPNHAIIMAIIDANPPTTIP